MFDNFSKILATNVRDESIERALRILGNEIRAPLLKNIGERLADLSHEEREAVEKLIITVVDNTLFNFFVMLEQETEVVNISILNDDSVLSNPVEIKGNRNHTK